MTIIISTRCGQDPIAIPPTPGGFGYSGVGPIELLSQITERLIPKGVFSHTEYSFPSADSSAATNWFAKRSSAQEAGSSRMMQANRAGDPVREPQPSELEQSWEPGPVKNSRFAESEMQHITVELRRI
ncbi:MAG: hypothetical protein U5K37_05215 [Natrialbaceae archaeon]|nr:hypothetical protein [Natrialbaceae archaeon]